MSRLHGALLIGGKSRRMGQNKALMNMNGSQSQASRCLEILKKLCHSVVVSCADETSVPEELSGECIITDQHGEIGPCGAILSVMESESDADWLILACDYPLIDLPTIETLVREYESMSPQTKTIAFASRIDGRPEPLCSIYHRTLIASLRKWIGEDKRCARHFIEDLEPKLLKLPNMLALENANTPEELSEIKAKASGRGTEKTIKVLYFANLREQANRDEEIITTTSLTSAGVYDELRVQHGFSLDPKHIRIAINEEFAEWGQTLNDGDELVFIPPVAGG